MMFRELLLTFLCAAPFAAAQTHSFEPLPADPFVQDAAGALSLSRPVQTGQPFTVAGPEGVIVGQQQGVFEAWLLPIKLLSHFTVEAEVEGYPVPLDLNSMAREIVVRPDRTVITYSHIAVTVHQTMFAPEGSGTVVLFQVDATRPVDLTFRFTPEMRPMWPQAGGGNVSPEWVAESAVPGSSGLYLLHTDSDALTGAIALPGATPGIMAPYQERPQVHPLELRLHVTPADRGKLYPLLMAAGRTSETAAPAALKAKLAELDAHLSSIAAAHQVQYARKQAELTSIQTPDAALDAAFSWAAISIEQLRARAEPTGEIGLVAGYYASGDSARPGFGWFFGRDTLYTLYAVNGFGDFALSRAALEFLVARQRVDGKVMHEYSQTAAFLDWKALPYEYAAADATPLFLTAIFDYVRTSGDAAFLERNRQAVLNAWKFETTHDSDGDGIYDNAQGTGWVESWPTPSMPKQEIYLALLDAQASTAMSSLATLLHEPALAAAALQRAAKLHATIEQEYLRNTAAKPDLYAFNRNPDGGLDQTSTIFPAIAWWNGGPGLGHPDASLRRWASHDFATDWGARDVAESEPFYDPISYHQGSVWPLFTGWAAVAQYRSGHALAGFQALMQNVELTEAQDLGAVTELLSGSFFEPFGRSTSHQLWSSAMVITPLLRGMFGLEIDGLTHTIRVAPHLPADWPGAEIRTLAVGESKVDLTLRREGRTLLCTLHQISGPPVHFSNTATILRVPLPPIEVALSHGLPQPGSRTAQMKILNEIRTANSYQLELEAQGGSQQTLAVTRNNKRLRPRVEGAVLTGDTLTVSFPQGAGYETRMVTLRW